MHCTRRSFMGVTLAGAAALGLTRPARAAGSQKLIVVFARGAWDPVWTIDPKVPAMTPDIDSPAGTIKKFLNNKISVLTDPSRPSIEAFFAAYASECAVVRGIDVGSIAHFSAHVRMMTGTRTELNPDLGAITGVELGAGLALPYADIGGGAYAGPYAAQMGRLGKHNQIITLINREGAAFKPATQVDYATAPLLVPKKSEAALIRGYVEARAEKAAQLRGAQGENARRLTDYRACFQRADDLRAIDALQGPKLSSTGLAEQIDLALTMLASSSSAVYLDSGQDWDTHTNIDDQGKNAEALFADLGGLMDKLKAKGMLGNTTVVVMSEMGRTPRLNAPSPTGGKDHWPVTSAMVLGAGVVPGAYGGTDNKLNGRNVNLANGTLQDDGKPLRYDNFAAGVLKLVGIEPDGWLPGVTPMGGFRA